MTRAAIRQQLQDHDFAFPTTRRCGHRHSPLVRRIAALLVSTDRIQMADQRSCSWNGFQETESPSMAWTAMETLAADVKKIGELAPIFQQLLLNLQAIDAGNADLKTKHPDRCRSAWGIPGPLHDFAVFKEQPSHRPDRSADGRVRFGNEDCWLGNHCVLLTRRRRIRVLFACVVGLTHQGDRSLSIKSMRRIQLRCKGLEYDVQNRRCFLPSGDNTHFGRSLQKRKKLTCETAQSSSEICKGPPKVLRSAQWNLAKAQSYLRFCASSYSGRSSQKRDCTSLPASCEK